MYARTTDDTLWYIKKKDEAKSEVEEPIGSKRIEFSRWLV